MKYDPFRPRHPESDALAVLVPALVLTGLGLICVYSFGGDRVLKQAVWAVVGVISCIAVSRIPLERLRRAATPLLLVTGACLVGALLFAPTVEGTRRWLIIGSLGYFQPSELAKLAVVIFLADRLARRGERKWTGVVWPVLVICVLVLAGPDFGTSVFLGAVTVAMLLIAGARMGPLVGGLCATLPVLLFAATRYPHVRERLAFFSGHLNFQQEQALIALGSGGMLGNGLGAGRQKMFYLPAGHTDFVLPNVGEELGFLGVILVCVLFALLCVHGVRVALAAGRKDRFAFYIACGATFVVVFQAVLNIAVATAAAPTKGISLPFLSQGGSNLLMALVAVGLIVNVGRSREAVS